MFFPVLFSVSLLFCFLLAFVSVPLFYVLAEPLGMLDRPGLSRRIHRHVTPRTGGLAIFPAFLVTSFLFCHTDRFLIVLWCGGAAMLLLGALDDAYGLPAPAKLLLGLLVAALTTGFLLPASDFSLATRLLTFVWISAVTNAHNMIDGLDGLCGGVSALEALALCVWLLIAGAPSVARAALFLATALAAFLIYNRYPAKVFLGDAGTLSVGFILALLSLRAALAGHGDFRVAVTQAISLSGLNHVPAVPAHLPLLLRPLVPVLICALPLTDLLFAVGRRLLRGQSVLRADRGHLHHLLIDSGVPVRAATDGLVFLSGCLAATGLLLLSPVGCAPALLPLVCGIVGAPGRPLKVLKHPRARTMLHRAAKEN